MTATTVPRQRWLVPSTGRLLLGVLAAWVLLWLVLRGNHTLPLAPADLTPLHRRLNDFAGALLEARASNPIFTYLLEPIRAGIDAVVSFLQSLISVAPEGRPVPEIGWLGVVAIVTAVSLLWGNVRVAILTCVGFLSFGVLGLWQETMDTLALTLASVVIALLLALPFGILAGLSDRAQRLITPVLDFMQVMPAFVYLAPLTLVFLIGPASATIATVIYSTPPAIRITAHAIRSVPRETVEAASALGSTRTQTLVKVQLPIARRTLILGVNQTMMAALSMATVTALIDAPGLGAVIVDALQSLQVGRSFIAGFAIVVLAIVLDRVTNAAGERAGRQRGLRTTFRRRIRWLFVGGVLALVAFLVYLSRTYVWAATFSSSVQIAQPIESAIDSASNWLQVELDVLTIGLRNVATYGLLEPLEGLLSGSPWYVTAAALIAVAAIVGGIRAVVSTAICLALIAGSGLWQDAMATLAATLVATCFVLVLGVLVGVWCGRSLAADRVIRPFLDAAQVMPPFVYLVPFLGLFGATRFTAVVAAVVYAAPVSIKLVSDGIRQVSPEAVEAARSAGSTAFQEIWKVQLPMARRALVVAANQGLIYVLAMVVVGGLVGAGALGYDVVAGFSQLELQGKGLAAGVAIVLLGIMLDRITQAAVRRRRT